MKFFFMFHSVSSITQGDIRRRQKEAFWNEIATRLVLQQFIDKVNGSADISGGRWWQFAEQPFSMEHSTFVLTKILHGKPCEGISIILTSISLSCELRESRVSTCR